MASAIESGVVRGRLISGVSFLINKNLLKFTAYVVSAERYAAVRINDCLLMNVYLPCSGKPNTSLIISDILFEVLSLREQYPDCYIVISGDLNVNHHDEEDTQVSTDITDVIESHKLIRCHLAFDYDVSYTSCNESLIQFSKLDYCLISEKDYIIDFKVFYSGISNFCDHIPLMLTCLCCKPVFYTITVANTNAKSKDNSTVIRLRWDHADLTRYYNYTGQELQSILNTIHIFISKLYSGVSPEGVA